MPVAVKLKLYIKDVLIFLEARGMKYLVPAHFILGSGEF